MNRNQIFIIIGIIVLASYLFLTSQFFLKKKAPIHTADKIAITTSFYPLYFFASQIGGDRVSVYNITPPGAEPHEYEPTPKDIVQIRESKLLLLHGVKLESWGGKIRDQLQGASVKILTVGDALATAQIIENNRSVNDPHIWLSPLLAKQEIEIILRGLIEVDPENSILYQKNTQKLLTQIDKLDGEYRLGLSNCRHREIITSHIAFGYLANAYGLRQIAIAGLSPDIEPSSKQLANIANFAKRNSIKFIFFEKLVSPKLTDTIATEVGAKVLVLDPIEGVTDEDIKKGINYLTIMNTNLKNLRLALECK